MEKVLVLFSGGVESSALLVHYAKKGFLAFPLYVRFGYPWEDYELRNALRVLNHLRSRYLNIRNIRIRKAKAVLKSFGRPKREKELEIPLRNLILCTVGAQLGYRLGIYRLAHGSLGLYPFPDSKRDYFDELEEVISKGLGRKFVIETPFYGMHKGDILRLYGKEIPLELTLSCISPVNGKPCGKCIKCKEREEALSSL
ncbi:7-cyano-7-deazaguanine synthase [Aquifex sp.]